MRNITLAAILLAIALVGCSKKDETSSPSTMTGSTTSTPDAPGSQDVTGKTMKIHTGMARQKVIEELGPPASIIESSGEEVLRYRMGSGSCLVTIQNGEVYKIGLSPMGF